MNVQFEILKDAPGGMRTSLVRTTSMEEEWYGGTDNNPGGGGSQEPFLQNVLQSIRGFVRCVDTADFADRVKFQRAIWFLGQMGVAEAALATIFGATTNAVNRWMNGRSAPSPVVRLLAIQAGLEMLRAEGVKVAGQRHDVITGAPMNGDLSSEPLGNTIMPS